MRRLGQTNPRRCDDRPAPAPERRPIWIGRDEHGRGRIAKVRAIKGLRDLHRRAQFARTVGQLDRVLHAPVSPHPHFAFRRFDGADQHRFRATRRLAHRIDAPVISVDEIDVSKTGRAKHDASPRCLPDISMRSRIAHKIGLSRQSARRKNRRRAPAPASAPKAEAPPPQPTARKKIAARARISRAHFAIQHSLRQAGDGPRYGPAFPVCAVDVSRAGAEFAADWTGGMGGWTNPGGGGGRPLGWAVSNTGGMGGNGGRLPHQLATKAPALRTSSIPNARRCEETPSAPPATWRRICRTI